MALSFSDNISSNTGNLISYENATGVDLSMFTDSAVAKWAETDWQPSALFPSADVINQLGVQQPPSFTFITAPADISYGQESDVQTVSMFGTNEPPVTVGQTNMKTLTLSDALMEGFTVGKSVQKPIDELFAMMNVELKSGFVNVPVYNVSANERSYSSREGGWIIKSVRVKEELRDLKGNLTRAKVDVELQEVGSYQINTGVDQANQVGVPQSVIQTPTNAVKKQEAAVAAANAQRSTPAS